MKIQGIGVLKSRSGIATGLLVGLIAFVLIIVAAGVWAAKNHKVLIAKCITAGTLHESGSPWISCRQLWKILPMFWVK